MSDYTIQNQQITVAQYQELRGTTGWYIIDDDTVGKALEKDLYSITVFDADKLIGMGRIVGDGALYFYIQDIVVIPEYQGKGIGKMIMDDIEQFLAKAAKPNSFVGLMSAKDVAPFYERYGFEKRAADRPGMFKLMD